MNGCSHLGNQLKCHSEIAQMQVPSGNGVPYNHIPFNILLLHTSKQLKRFLPHTPRGITADYSVPRNSISNWHIVKQVTRNFQIPKPAIHGDQSIVHKQTPLHGASLNRPLNLHPSIDIQRFPTSLENRRISVFIRFNLLTQHFLIHRKSLPTEPIFNVRRDKHIPKQRIQSTRALSDKLGIANDINICVKTNKPCNQDRILMKTQ
ncbi:hypothetical protein VIGAN_10229600 [Vigna angularis var. angularis]|uniref:Uncharacterized protein n=1 Tax=Vigna angularis var. angularis TaxID=157739 RepID=A0A0S3T621_PHAAN|nr:hypothetical protein VIGAN_10229600 [Vigna angularis var. angularis]